MSEMYHMQGTLEVALKAYLHAYLHPSYQHCTDEAQKAVKRLHLTRLLVKCLPEIFLSQAFVDLSENKLSYFCFSFSAFPVCSFTFLVSFSSLHFCG